MKAHDLTICTCNMPGPLTGQSEELPGMGCRTSSYVLDCACRCDCRTLQPFYYSLTAASRMPRTQMAMMMPSTAPQMANLPAWYVHARRSTVQSSRTPCMPAENKSDFDRRCHFQVACELLLACPLPEHDSCDEITPPEHVRTSIAAPGFSVMCM